MPTMSSGKSSWACLKTCVIQKRLANSRLDRNLPMIFFDGLHQACSRFFFFCDGIGKFESNDYNYVNVVWSNKKWNDTQRECIDKEYSALHIKMHIAFFESCLVVLPDMSSTAGDKIRTSLKPDKSHPHAGGASKFNTRCSLAQRGKGEHGALPGQWGRRPLRVEMSRGYATKKFWCAFWYASVKEFGLIANRGTYVLIFFKLKGVNALDGRNSWGRFKVGCSVARGRELGQKRTLDSQ